MSLLASFRAARWVKTLNLVLQAVLFLTLFGGLNYLAQNPALRDEPWRLDLTRFRRFSLSPETTAYLRALSSPVRIIVTQAETTVPTDLRGLLREYALATENHAAGRITVEYLNVDLNRRAAQQLGLEQPGQVVLICNGKPQSLAIDQLFVYRQQEKQAFDGEARLTAALLEVSSPDRRKIYFLVGHQELQPDDTDPNVGLSAARDLLRQRNFVVGTLDLESTRAIPPDASVLISAGPRTPFSSREQELLRQYLSAREGRLIVLAAPNTRPGLGRLLADWGVTLDDDLVQDSGAENLTEDGDLILRRFAAHPATQALLNGSFQPRLRLGPARSIEPEASFAAANGLDVVALASTSPTAWGEVRAAFPRNRRFVAGVDLAAPPAGLAVAVASAHAAARDSLPFSVRNGRLVVIGSGDLFDNARIAHEGAVDFLLGAVNWMTDRDRELSIPARPLERFQLSLSARELQNLRYSLLFLIPGAAALLGIIVYWARRS